MKQVYIITEMAEDEGDAARKCLEVHGFYPDAVREVYWEEGKRGWKCFESQDDARIWDQQS